MKSKLAWGLLAVFGGYLIIRRLGQRSGATDEEVDSTLPGDEVIPHPMVETTHAITIQAPPAEVWRWLVQTGYRGSGRAGWYTDSPIDPVVDIFFRLTTPADREAADRSWMHSADSLLPEFQQRVVGDIVPDGPPGTAYFVVRASEPERLLVLYSDTHIKLITPAFLQSLALGVVWRVHLELCSATGGPKRYAPHPADARALWTSAVPTCGPTTALPV